MLVVGAATFLADSSVVYSSTWFCVLWAAVALASLVAIWRAKMWRKPLRMMLHTSLLVILLGALLTRLTSRTQMLHLRQGEVNTELGVALRLDTFYVDYYDGTLAPRDYVSLITSEGAQQTVRMNHTGSVARHRLFQTSYDPDHRGTLLTATYDPYGTAVTYVGYLLFLVSFLFPRGFLKGRIPLRASMKWGFFIVFCLLSTRAEASLPTISRAKADSLERVQIMWNARQCPIGTAARAFLRKVYGRETYHGLSATQVVCSWTLAPKAWNNQPIVKRRRGVWAKIADFIDESGPVPVLKGMGQDERVDERVALCLMLQQGTLLTALPSEVEPMSEARVSTDLFYHRTPWAMMALVIACVACTNSLLRRRRKRKRSLFKRLCTLGLVLLLVAHFALRWYLAEHLPLSSTYETLMFIALCLAPWVPLGTVCTLVVAMLLENNPQITPLVPVLNSPWLSAHVTCVMLAYALLVVSFFRRSVLRIAVSLLGVGIFLGAVWASVSWGTYWSWDPKESWALITFVAYALPLHETSMPWFKSTRNYRIYSVLAFLTLLMTYLGVNHLLGGLHSYG